MKQEHKTHYKNIKITKLPHSEVEIEGEIEADELERCRIKAIKKLGEQVEIAGFRKGHIPEPVLVSKIGEMAVMEEAAEMVLDHEYRHIVVDNNVEVIGRPQITLTKLAQGNPLGFKILVAVFPETTLPDYKKIAAKEMKGKDDEKIEVTEKDISAVIDQIKKSQLPTSDKEAPESVTSAEKKEMAKEEPLTDEFVKKLGAFKDVADFMKKLKENLLLEKRSQADEKRRISISEKIVVDTKIDIPEILVESELDKMSAQFKNDIERMGLKMEDYLKHIKKTEEEMRKDWRKDAEKRVTLQIAFNKIALAEKIVPDEKEVEKESAHLLEHHKDADPERVRAYVETMLLNEKVFRFLESQ